jgi:porphobilinogen synthase
VIDASLKYPDGREARNPDGLVPRVVRELKARFPNLGVMTDVALDRLTATARMARSTTIGSRTTRR